MPPEPLPWDRKDFFKERKHERSSGWRESPHRDFSRWGSSEFRSSRPPGQGKQGGWHIYPEESGHGFAPSSRFNEKSQNDENFRPFGKYSRNNGRENRGSWKAHLWENGASPNGPGRSGDDNHDTLTSNSHSLDEHDKTGSVNGLGAGQRFEGENSVGSIDWKPLKWSRSGSLSSRSSGFSHSGSSKSMGVDSGEVKAEVSLRNVTPVQSPSGDAVACAISAARSEETSSRKKPRLGWGEGLAKYEKKKVDGPDDSVTKNGGVGGSVDTLHFQVLSSAVKSPRVAGFSDCASPATPSSVACSSSPGVEEKPFVKSSNSDNDITNLNGSPSLSSQNHFEERAFNLENMELTPTANLSSSLSELLPSDDPGSVDSSFVRSTAMNKLLVWKGDILKALEMTESEIDSLENELKLLKHESGNGCPRPAASSSLQGECKAKPCEELVLDSNLIPRPAPLRFVSSGDMVLEKTVGGLGEEHSQVRDEDVDSPGTVTSKLVEPLSSAKGATLSDQVKHGENCGDLDPSKRGNLDVKCSVYGSNEEKKEGLSASEGGRQLLASTSCSASTVGVCLHSGREDIPCDIILASNKDSANRASEVFNTLLPFDQSRIDISRMNIVSSWPNDPQLKERFAMRKHFLRFKERVITLKFRAFQHLWKEDMRLLSIKKYRAKSQNSRAPYASYQKHRSSIRSRFSSPVGNLSLVPTSEIINFTSKLLSDSQLKLYRNSLKMPALILDKKEKIISRFISSNGLIEDPCAVEKERTMINPWTTEEKEIFMNKLATLGKDFRKIASFLDHKTTADCIDFYYKNHKSDCFVKTKKPEFAKQGKSCYTSNYLLTSGKRWNRGINAASLDLLGAASAIAAKAEDDAENQQKCTSKFLLRVSSDHRATRGGDGIVERSGSPDVFDNERETVAADVLAGICGSLSSEAMSSCITSSFDPGESYQDRNCQKVGSLTRRPMTPEVTQNVDDETCSDESCGEMDPTDWTDEEKSTFIKAVSAYGTDFSMISRCVRTRSRDQCKVFYSKARKCLGLDMFRPTPGDEGIPVSDDANGGGSDNEDACVVETYSAICSEKSGSKMDEDMMLSDLNMNHCDSDPAEIMNLQTDISRSENNGTGQVDCKDAELLSEHLITDELQAECKPDFDFDADRKMENGVECSVIVQAHESAVLPPDTEEVEATGEDASLGEPVSAEVANDHGLSVSGAEGETITVGQDSTKLLITELEVQQLASEKKLNDKQDENGDADTIGPSDLICSKQNLHRNSNAFDFAADRNAPEEFGVSPKQEQKIALELNPPPEPLVVSLDQDVSLVGANSATKVSPSSQYENAHNQDTPLTLDFEVSDKRCQKSSSFDDYINHQSGHSALEGAESCPILRGYPLLVTTKKETSEDFSSKKLTSFQSLSKDFHSDTVLQECFLQKCNSSKSQSSVPELRFPSQELKVSHSRPHSWSSSDKEKPRRNGDVKLFGKILTDPSSHQHKQNTNGIHENEDNRDQHPKFGSKNFNPKFTDAQSVAANSVLPKFDRINYLGLENVPRKSYGFWDGNRIQTGFSALPDSAILLAKYPAAFSNYSTSSSNMGQQLHSLVKSNERNLNGVSVFSAREMSSSNGVTEYQLYSNREGLVQPFSVDVKQRQDVLLSEMQRRNGFDSVSGIQQQGVGMVGINVVGRGGILVGGACNSVSDPVAAIKMHFAKAEQYNGQTAASILREEESWRGKGGDIGR